MSFSSLCAGQHPETGGRWPAVFFFFLATWVCRQAGAHDLWIVPGTFHLEAARKTRVFINNGDSFPESLSLLGAHRVERLEVRGPTQTTDVSELRIDGNSLTFELSPKEPGAHVLALETRPRLVRLSADEFNDYLEEEGLERALELREELGELEEAAVERYTKWAKVVVQVGETSLEDEEDEPWARPVGHTLEIVPGSHPNRVVAGSQLEVQVLYEGEPVAGLTLVGARAGGPAREIRTVTDSKGMATVRPESSGRWYLRGIHMIRFEADPQVRWESFWCTLSFEVGPGARGES